MHAAKIIMQKYGFFTNNSNLKISKFENWKCLMLKYSMYIYKKSATLI